MHENEAEIHGRADKHFKTHFGIILGKWYGISGIWQSIAFFNFMINKYSLVTDLNSGKFIFLYDCDLALT